MADLNSWPNLWGQNYLYIGAYNTVQHLTPLQMNWGRGGIQLLLIFQKTQNIDPMLV